MKISTKGRYALRLMIDIAKYGKDSNVSLKDASKRQGISLKYLEQIVMLLSKDGLLVSRRGSQGGYRIAKDPKLITVSEILRVTEGSMAPVACLDDEVNKCKRVSSCPTIKLWEGLYDAVMTYLDNVTLDDLVSHAGDFSDNLCEDI